MATTIGSLDLNAFSDLYNDSTQYFWFEGNSSATYGAGVHVTLSPETSFIANPSGQNILMNTDGISLRNGLLPMMTLDNDSLDFNMIDTTSGTYTNMATLGLQTRIGRNETGYSRILIDPSSDNSDLINAFEILTPDDISAFSQKIDKTRQSNMHNKQFYDDDTYVLSNLFMTNVTETPYTSNDVISIHDLSNIHDNANVCISIESVTFFRGSGMVYVSQPTIMDSISFNIIKGQPSTTSMTITQCAGEEIEGGVSQGFTNAMQIIYDGNQQFNISSTVQRIANDGIYTIWTMYIYKMSWELVDIDTPILVQSGDAILNDDVFGITCIGLDVDVNADVDTNATSGEDKDLFNTIRSLGWYDDVMCGVTISPTSATIGNTGNLSSTVQLTAKAVPEDLQITWTNLNPDNLTLTNDGVVGYQSLRAFDQGRIQVSVKLFGRTYYAISTITISVMH